MRLRRALSLESGGVSTAMTTQLRLVGLRTIPQTLGITEEQPTATDRVGRPIQIALALYLVPALVVVLVVGAVGMLILATARLFVGHGGGAAA